MRINKENIIDQLMNQKLKERSFTITEDERFYARKDYEGLSKEAQEDLLKERSKAAEQLRSFRKMNNNRYGRQLERAEGRMGDVASATATRNSSHIQDLNRIKSIKESARNSAEASDIINGRSSAENIFAKKPKTTSNSKFVSNKEAAKKKIDGKDLYDRIRQSKEKVNKGTSLGKKALIGTGIAAGLGAAIYGGKKLYNHYKNKKEE